MESNLITILLPIYNDERYIRECVQSLLSQDHSDFFCLIGFNGTVDGSKKIVNSLVSEDQRFHIFDFGDDKGKSKTLNKLFHLVETEYVCLIDGDDIWMPNKLSRQIEIMSDNKMLDVLSSWCFYMDENSSHIGQLRVSEKHSEIKEKCFSGNNQIVNSAFIAKTQSIKEIDGWDETLPGLEDYDMWIKLLRDGCQFQNVPEFLIAHRLHSQSNFNAQPLGIYPGDILARNLK